MAYLIGNCNCRLLGPLCTKTGIGVHCYSMKITEFLTLTDWKKRKKMIIRNCDITAFGNNFFTQLFRRSRLLLCSFVILLCPGALFWQRHLPFLNLSYLDRFIFIVKPF